MNNVQPPLSYAPPRPRAGPRPAAWLGLTLVGAALLLLAVATRITYVSGPWVGRMGGRERATIYLTGCSVMMALVASLAAVLGWSRRRRGVVEILALVAAALYWISFVLVAVVAGALK